MKRYRKRPVAIEAIQIVDKDSFNDAAAWIRLNGGECSTALFPEHMFYQSHILIHTLEGNMMARPMDWVIKGVQGEFYPCQPQIFDETYEPMA